MAEAGGPEAEAEADLGVDTGAAVAVALDAARRRRGKQDSVDAFLEDQRRLIADQRLHLHEQLGSVKLKRFSDRLKIVFELFGALVATAVALFIAGLVWQAAHDRRLVVEPLSAPPDLVARGVTGRVLAARLLDGLAQINADASSGRAPTDYAANWGEEAKVEIPETGVSIGELQRFLSGWLGHETHISGDLVRTVDGRLSLTVRSGDEPGRTYEGAETELPALMKQAAEGAFEATQPYRYTVYLFSHGRKDESLKATQALAEADVPRREKAWAWTQLSNIYTNSGDASAAIAAAQRAISLDADMPIAYFNLSSSWYELGRDEQALRTNQEGIARLHRRLPDVAALAVDYFGPANQSVTADQLGDFAESARLINLVLDMPDVEGFRPALTDGYAYELARNHQVAASRRVGGPGGDATGAMYLFSWGETFMPAYEQAVALDDWAAAAADMDAVIQGAPKQPAIQNTLVNRFLAPRLAYALARGGQQARAEQLAAALPRDCYRCLIARGWVAAVGRDQTGAETAFDAAERLAPSLPAAWLAQGQSRLARGDRAGAQAAFAEAVKRGPHDADALESWGESLAAGGDLAGATAKYAEAAKHAPRWGRLRLRWGQALARQGRREDARAQFAAAAGMDLSAADRAELAAQKL